MNALSFVQRCLFSGYCAKNLGSKESDPRQRRLRCGWTDEDSSNVHDGYGRND